jgi:hypothetical protein
MVFKSTTVVQYFHTSPVMLPWIMVHIQELAIVGLRLVSPQIEYITLLDFPNCSMLKKVLQNSVKRPITRERTIWPSANYPDASREYQYQYPHNGRYATSEVPRSQSPRVDLLPRIEAKQKVLLRCSHCHLQRQGTEKRLYASLACQGGGVGVRPVLGGQSWRSFSGSISVSMLV